MEFTIYTSGNFDFMMMIFNGLAMAFDEASGDFGNANYIMGLGLVIAVFAGSIKGIMEKGQPDLSLVAKGWVLWCILFLPRTDIAIEHAGTGDVAYYTGIPAGLAMGGAVATQIPVSMVDTLANIFVMPSYSGEHIDAFKTLIKQERVIASHPKLTTLTYGAQSTDFVKSFDNYIQDCVLLDMEMGVNQDVFGAMLRTSADPWANMKVNSGSWFTQIKINSGSSDFETMTCTDAYSALDSQLGSSSSAFATVLNSINEQEGIDVSQVTNSMLQMGGGSIDAFTLQVNNFIDYRLMQISSGMSDGSKLDHYFDGIQFQAKQQRIMSMSGDANLWMEMAPVITTIIEALMWFMAPIVSFMVLLGTGHSLIVKYFRFLVVVGMFPVVSILINLYLDWSITNYIEPYAASGEIWSIGGLHNFYTTAGSYVAIAGYLTMAIPMIAYAFVTGSDYMISGLANRMGSTAHINPKAASPDVASPVSNGVYRFGNQSMTMTDNGTVHTTSALNDINAPKLNAISQTSQSVNQQLQQAKTQLSASEQSAQKSVSKMLNRVTEAMDTKGSGTDTTTNLSHNEQKLMGLAEDIQKQTGWTADKSVAAAAQLTAHVGAEGRGSVSGGILTMAMGGGIKLSGSGDVRLTDKEMEQARKAIGLKTDDKGSVSADFRKSDAYKDMQTINKRNGWTDQASRMVSNIDRYAEQQQVVDSLARSSQAMASISNPATTDFTKAAEHKKFANWVASGGNYMQLSDEEKSLRAAAIEKSAALYHNNDIGRAAAKMFVNDYKKMSDDLVGWKAPEKPGELAGSKAPADTAAVYQNLSEMLGGAGKMIGDSNLITMSENMAGIASKLQSETAPKLNRPEGVPTKQKVNQDFNAEESKTVGLVAQGDKEAKANNGQVLENKYNQNKDVVRTSGSALAAEVASMNPAVAAEVAEAKTKIPGNVDTLPSEALVLGDSAVGVLKDGLVEASNTAMKYIDTDTQKALDKGVEGASSPKFAEKGIEAVTQQSDMELVAALKDGTGVNATREQRLEALAITSVAFGDNSLVSNAVEAGRQGTHPHNSEHNAALEAKQNAVNQYLGNLKQSNPEAYRDLVTTSQLLNSGAITGKGVEAMLAPRGSLDPEQSHLAAQTAQTLMDNGVAVDKSVLENAGSQVRKVDLQGFDQTTYGKTNYGAGTSGYQPDKPVQNQGRAVELGERVKAANDVVANLSQQQRPVAMDAITALKSEGGLAGYAGRQVEMFNNGNLAPAQFAQARNAINQIADNLDDKAPQFIKDDVAQAQAQVNEAAAQFMNPVPQQNTTAVTDERGDGSHVVSTKLFNAVEQTPKGEQVVLNGDGYTKLAQSDDRQQQYLRNEKTGQNYVLDNQDTFWFGVKMKPIEEDQLPSSAQNMLPSSDSTSRYHTSSSHGEGASPAMGYYQNSGRNTTDSYPVSSRGSNSVPATTDNIKASSPESSQNQAGDSSTTPVVQGRSQGYSPALEQAPNYRSGYVYQQYKPEHNPQPKDNANSHNAPVEQEPRSTNHTPPQSTNVSQPSVDPFQRMVELTRNEALSPQQPVHQAGVSSSPTPEKVTEPTSRSGTESKQASDTTPGQSGQGRNDVVAPQAPVAQGGDASPRPAELADNGFTEPKQSGDTAPRQAEQGRNDVVAPQAPVNQGGDASPRPTEPAGNGSTEPKQSGDTAPRQAEQGRNDVVAPQAPVAQGGDASPRPAELADNGSTEPKQSGDATPRQAEQGRNDVVAPQAPVNQTTDSSPRSSEPTSKGGTESKPAGDTTQGQSGQGRNDVVAPQSPVAQGGDTSPRPAEPAGNGSTEPKQAGDTSPHQAEQGRNDVVAPQAPVNQTTDSSPRSSEPTSKGGTES
ncbi:hypothetical protein, partial [uncultured Photobacterium sp.]|uniref:hypothetical protein n=1 Tax=uncultured Photobacterium sp. TaxID=173973 RepID=UPI00262F1D9A